MQHVSASGYAADSVMFWRDVPLYCSYIQTKTLDEVVQDCIQGLRACKTQRLTVSDACQTHAHLATTTLFPLAVACEYAHVRNGKPSTFVHDMFLACLASCINKDVAVSLYPAEDPDFLVRCRFWCTPTGEPNAGKSPTFDWEIELFKALMQESMRVHSRCRIPREMQYLGPLTLYSPPQ